jgi:hypothetical protein
MGSRDVGVKLTIIYNGFTYKRIRELMPFNHCIICLYFGSDYDYNLYFG